MIKMILALLAVLLYPLFRGTGAAVSTGDQLTATKQNLKLEDVDQADLGTINNLQLTAGTNPAGTVIFIGCDAAGDLTLNALTGKSVLIAIHGTDEFTFDGTTFILASGNSIKFAGDDGILDSNGCELIKFAAVASAITYLQVEGGATGNPVILSCQGEADRGFRFENDQDEELLLLTPVATAVTHLNILNAASGGKPTIQTAGAVDIGIDFETSESEEMLTLTPVATALYNLNIINAASGGVPTVQSAGAHDIGIDFETDEDEEILVLTPVATAVNHIEIKSAISTASPQVGAEGDDTDIDLLLVPKGTGSVDVNGVKIILDADGDTYLDAGTNDEIDVVIGGGSDFKFKANSFELQGGSDINVETATNEHVLFVSRNTVAYTDTTNKTLFVLPANAVIVDVILSVDTLFDDTGTDVLDVGTTVGDPDEYIDAQDVSSAAVVRMGASGTMPNASGSVGGASVTVLGKYTGQNANASGGSATVTIFWTTA